MEFDGFIKPQRFTTSAYPLELIKNNYRARKSSTIRWASAQAFSKWLFTTTLSNCSLNESS
jgi:hypothetical protein